MADVVLSLTVVVLRVGTVVELAVADVGVTVTVVELAVNVVLDKLVLIIVAATFDSVALK